MSWATTTLTTSATLARHEKEIALQAGSTSRWSVYVPAGETVWFSTSGTDIASVLLTYSDATTATVAVAADKVTLPTEKYITAIACYDVALALICVFDCTEGYGATITDTTGQQQVTLVDSVGNWTGWTETSADGDYSWSDKIALAKEIIGHRIETKLAEHGIVVDEAGGDVLLDVLTNAYTFNIASDYLTLGLIYLDLQLGGFNELFQRKYELYTARYEAELAEAFTRMNLDSSLSGTASEYRVEVLGRVTR